MITKRDGIVFVAGAATGAIADATVNVVRNGAQKKNVEKVSSANAAIGLGILLTTAGIGYAAHFIPVLWGKVFKSKTVAPNTLPTGSTD